MQLRKEIKMHRMKKIFVTIMVLVVLLLCGCSEADKANANISKQADYSNNELVCTVKIGPDTYRKNYIYLNGYTMYVVEDITGTHTDPYHYKLYFHTDILPSVETRP